MALETKSGHELADPSIVSETRQEESTAHFETLMPEIEPGAFDKEPGLKGTPTNTFEGFGSFA